MSKNACKPTQIHTKFIYSQAETAFFFSTEFLIYLTKKTKDEN